MTEGIVSVRELIALRSGQSTLRIHEDRLQYSALGGWHFFDQYEKTMPVSKDKPTCYFGLGSLDWADQLTEMGEGHKLYEPDPHRLALFLDRYPEFLSRKNWTVGCGFWFEDGFFDRDLEVIPQPFLGYLYRPLPDRLSLFTRTAEDSPALVVQIGNLFYRDVMDSLGKNVRNLVPFDLSLWSGDGLEFQLGLLPIKDLFSINLIEGLPRLAGQHQFDYCCWEIDPSTGEYDPVDKKAATSSRIYTFRRKNMEPLEKAGYNQVRYLPLAANPEERCPIDSDQIEEQYLCPISFVGSSLVANAQRWLDWVLGWIRVQRVNNQPGNWQEFSGWLQQWLGGEMTWGNPLPEIERQLARFEIPKTAQSEFGEINIAMTLAEYSASQKRLDLVETVGNQFPISVWGDSGWASHMGQYGRYHGEAGHTRELTKIYNGSDINLDINRNYQPDIVTMRVFDVMATGNVVLTETGKDVKELFHDEEEILFYDNRDQLLSRVATWLDKKEERRALGQRARKSIKKHHTIRHRLTEMNLIE